MTVPKFLQLVETTTDPQLVKEKYLFHELLFSFPFKRNDQQIQFKLTADYFLSSSKPLKAITNQTTDTFKIPSIEPLDPTVSILKENIYKVENIYRKYINLSIFRHMT